MEFKKNNNAKFLIEIELFITRILSLQNQNPLSKHYGCFDRNFWHFKTIIDFPSATYQQVLLGLSHLYISNYKFNKFYKSEKLKEIIKSGILYWCKIQNSDGSQNEYYENDRSFCPTALTTFAVSQSYILLGNIFSSQEKKIIVYKFQKAGDWLCKHDNYNVQNQMIASMISLNNISKITNENIYRKYFLKQKKCILKQQNIEGWFSEYGSADIGYSFIQLDFLCYFLMYNKDIKVFEASKKLILFISNFIHPDGTAGGSYGSRCTQHIMPFPLLYLANKKVPEAHKILQWYIKNKNIHRIINQNLIDDKYASYFYFNSYINFFLFNEKFKLDLEIKKLSNKLITNYPNTGLLIIKKNYLSIWLNWKKKGVSKIYYKDKKIFSDNGYLFRLSNNKLGVTQNFDEDAIINIDSKNQNINISLNGRASYFNDIVPLERWIVLFKIFSKYFLKFNSLSYWFNKKLKKKFVEKQIKLPILMNRSINILKTNIIIKDEIKIIKSSLTFTKVIRANDITTTHSPSSRFYQPQNILENFKYNYFSKSDKKYSFRYNINIKK